MDSMVLLFLVLPSSLYRLSLIPNQPRGKYKDAHLTDKKAEAWGKLGILTYWINSCLNVSVTFFMFAFPIPRKVVFDFYLFQPCLKHFGHTYLTHPKPYSRHFANSFCDFEVS